MTLQAAALQNGKDFRSEIDLSDSGFFLPDSRFIGCRCPCSTNQGLDADQDDLPKQAFGKEMLHGRGNGGSAGEIGQPEPPLGKCAAASIPKSP